MFVATYTAIQIYIKYGDWYSDVVFTTGSISYRRFESLMAFWPAVLVLLGDLHDAGRNLNAFYKGAYVQLYTLPMEFNTAAERFLLYMHYCVYTEPERFLQGCVRVLAAVYTLYTVVYCQQYIISGIV